MRLLYVIDSLAPGGAETSLTEMAPALVRGGIDLHVLSLGGRLDLAPHLERAGAIVHQRQTADNSGRLQSVREVISAAKRVAPTLIHTTLYEASIAGRTAAFALGLASSTSVVGDTYGPVRSSQVRSAKLRLANLADMATARFASRFHAVSNSLADAMVSHLRIPSEIIEVIPRGRDGHRFPFRPPGVREAMRAKLGLRNDTPVILAVARHEPSKGLIDLLHSLPVVARAFPELVVLVAGKDGRATPSLRAVAATLPRPVHFLGHRSDIASLLAAADVLAFPSLTEGSPGTLIEAMAVGCPIVASHIPPNLEVLISGEYGRLGILAPPNDPPKLAVGLMQILGGLDDVPTMICGARTRFESDFQIEAVAARMATFFRTAVGDAHSQASRGQ